MYFLAVTRGIYKDFVKFVRTGNLLTDKDLKTKVGRLYASYIYTLINMVEAG